MKECNFEEITIEKAEFHFSKEPIYISHVDIGRKLVSNKHSFEKVSSNYFVGEMNI